MTKGGSGRVPVYFPTGDTRLFLVVGKSAPEPSEEGKRGCPLASAVHLNLVPAPEGAIFSLSAGQLFAVRNHLVGGMAISSQTEMSPAPVCSVWRWEMVPQSVGMVDPSTAEASGWIVQKKEKLYCYCTQDINQIKLSFSVSLG